VPYFALCLVEYFTNFLQGTNIIGCIFLILLESFRNLIFLCYSLQKLGILPVYKEYLSLSIYLHAQQDFSLFFRAICFTVLAYKKNRSIFLNVNRDLQGNESIKKELAFFVCVLEP